MYFCPLTKIAECFDLGLSVIDKSCNVEKLIMVASGLVKLPQGLVGCSNVRRGSDLRWLVSNPLTYLQVQDMVLQGSSVFSHGSIDVTQTSCSRGFTSLILALPTIAKPSISNIHVVVSLNISHFLLLLASIELICLTIYSLKLNNILHPITRA